MVWIQANKAMELNCRALNLLYLLLECAGNPLQPSIRGINTAEMCGCYVDRAIDQALSCLNADQSTMKAQE